MDLLPLFFGIFAIVLIVYLQVLLIRWVFKIDQQIAHQRATVWFLIKLCEKHGVDAEEIKTVMTATGIK